MKRQTSEHRSPFFGPFKNGNSLRKILKFQRVFSLSAKLLLDDYFRSRYFFCFKAFYWLSLTFSVSELLPQCICCNRQHSLYSPEEDDVITFELERQNLWCQTSDVPWTSYTHHKNLFTLLAATVTSRIYIQIFTKIPHNYWCR